MIRVIEGAGLLLSAVGLGLVLFALGLFFGGAGAAIGWFVARGHYRTPPPPRVRPARVRRQARRTERVVLRGAHGGDGWPLFEPGCVAVHQGVATTQRLPRVVDVQPRTHERSPW